MTVRGFTHGYDYYTPLQAVAFHEYASGSDRRKSVPNFVEHSDKHHHGGEEITSLRRAMAIIEMSGMKPSLHFWEWGKVDTALLDWDRAEVDRYGLGKGTNVFSVGITDLMYFLVMPLMEPERSASSFYSFFLIEPKTATSAPLCPFVRDGEMHRLLHNLVQTNLCKGIDYRRRGVLASYSVKKYLQDALKKRIKMYMESRSMAPLKYAVTSAKRVDILSVRPGLIRRAEAMLNGGDAATKT